jgi:hypothetical protein
MMASTRSSERAPFQVLVIPYTLTAEDDLEYALFRRQDEGYWQFISGGGEGAETRRHKSLVEGLHQLSRSLLPRLPDQRR